MDKTFISLLSGASALALLGGAQVPAASTVGESDALQPARSFAELLDPIPNPEQVLRAEIERSGPADEKPLVMAQYYHHHHHHHYHHHYYHHHHHYYHHHHHYHHHDHYY